MLFHSPENLCFFHQVGQSFFQLRNFSFFIGDIAAVQLLAGPPGVLPQGIEFSLELLLFFLCDRIRALLCL